MTAAEPLLVETIEVMLADHCTPERVAAAEGGADGDLWAVLVEAGLTGVGIAESIGGSGGTRHDLAALATAAGRHAAPVPLVDHLAAAAALELAELPLPDGTLALGIVGERSTVRVPWGPVADRIVLADRTGLRIRPRDDLVVDGSGVDHAGDPWLDVLSESSSRPDARVDVDRVVLVAALARAAAVAGALERATELTILHAEQREQFGRPIGRFQIIQHHLAAMAGETVAAVAAVDEAVEAWAGGGPLEATVATARVVGGRATALVARLAHQIHGAIGFTDEHRLHLTTRRLWSWRDQRGTEAQWAARLGRTVLAGGGCGPVAHPDRVASRRLTGKDQPSDPPDPEGMPTHVRRVPVPAVRDVRRRDDRAHHAQPPRGPQRPEPRDARRAPRGVPTGRGR